MFDDQSKMISKRFDRLETKYNSLRNRVSKLEGKQKKKKPVLSYKLKPFVDTFENDYELEFPATLHRKIPRDFPLLITYCFQEEDAQNVHIKGERLYVYLDNQWMMQTKKPFLEKLNQRLWGGLVDLCEIKYPEKKIGENEFSISKLQDIIVRTSTAAAVNRKNF